MLKLIIKPFESDEYGYKKAAYPQISFVLAIVAANDSNRVIHSFLSATSIDPVPYQNLMESLNSNPPKTLNDCIFIATYFSELAEKKVQLFDFINPEIHDNEVLNHILIASFGKIIYNYQLENLYQFALLNDKEGSIAFRKAVNKKDNEAIYKTKEISFSNESTLFDILQKHLPFGYAYYPNYFGGKVLWEELRKINS